MPQVIPAWELSVGMYCVSRHGIGAGVTLALALAWCSVPACAQDAAAGAPSQFPVYAIDVTGVSRIPQARIEEAVYPYLGENRTPADIEAARKAVQDAYAKAGYEAVIVEVPPQPQDEFAAGVVRLAVSEVPVAQVAVSGARHHDDEGVRRALPSVRPGEPLNFAELQRDIEQANRFPDREVTPAFDAGEAPGTIDVNLQVRDSSPFHASAELNNDNSPNTVPLRATGSVRYTNLWGAGHTITAGGSVAPERPKDTTAFFGSYLAPIYGSPWTIVASGYVSNSNIAALGGTNVLGNGWQVGAQAIYRLDAARDYHAFRVGLDYKDFQQDIRVEDGSVSEAPIQYIPLVLGYDFSQARDGYSLDLAISATLGLRVIKHVMEVKCPDGVQPPCFDDQFTNRELDAIENFAHINLDTSTTVKFGGDWHAFARISGQYADSHLVSNEQFAMGGLTSARGYYQSEVVGDRGVGSTLELRAPSLATRIGTWVDDLQFYAFGDAGVVSIINPLPDTESVFRVASVGGGVRLKVFGHLSGEALVGLPLISTSETDKYDPRFTFLVKGEF